MMMRRRLLFGAVSHITFFLLCSLSLYIYCFLSLLQEQNKETTRKLGITTVLMFTLPIISYYVGLYLFADKNQPDSWAGGMAIIMTNLIVAGYVIIAFQEKDGDVREQPRVGAFKTRTD